MWKQRAPYYMLIRAIQAASSIHTMRTHLALRATHTYTTLCACLCTVTKRANVYLQIQIQASSLNIHFMERPSH